MAVNLNCNWHNYQATAKCAWVIFLLAGQNLFFSIHISLNPVDSAYFFFNALCAALSADHVYTGQTAPLSAGRTFRTFYIIFSLTPNNLQSVGVDVCMCILLRVSVMVESWLLLTSQKKKKKKFRKETKSVQHGIKSNKWTFSVSSVSSQNLTVEHPERQESK